jgi:hypothetical protein
VTTPGGLSYQVFISDPIPFDVTERAPNGDRRMFEPISSTLNDDPKIIAETRRYLEDAERLIGTSHTALEFYNAMIELYPDRLNPSALWFWGARTLCD